MVHVEPPKPHIRKMHNTLLYKIYLTHPSGEEVHTHAHIISEEEEQKKKTRV